MKRESLLWFILFFLTAVLRLVGLGAAPLASAEAVQALAAYGAAHGGGVPPEAQTISPLLFHAHVLLFALFGGGDGLARLLPAFCGIGLALTPLLLRRYLGRWGALGSSLLLALSPSLIALSRSVDGSIPAALGVMLLVGAVARYLDSWQSAWIPLGGIGLALALTAGPAAWGLLLGLVLALGVGLWVWREQVAWYWPMLRPALGRALAALALGLFSFGAGLGFHPAGLAAAGEQFLRWLFPGDGYEINFVLLGASEPLILLTGIAGAALALSRRHGMGLLWLFWSLVGFIQWAIGRGGLGPVLWLVPLAGLGGLAVEGLARALQRDVRGAAGWVYGALALTLWAHFGLVLARYSRYGNPADLLLGGIGLALQALLILLFGVALSVPEGDETPEAATRRALLFVLYRAALALGVVLLAVTFAAGWRVARVCPGEPACAPGLIPDPVASDLRRLSEEIGRVRRTLGPGTALWLVDPDPAVAWALRDVDFQIVPAEQVGRMGNPTCIVAPAGVSVPEGYYGTAFTLRRAWLSPQAPYQWVRWWLYRDPPSPPPPADQVILWVRSE
ncbi:MAG: hypothetical protein ACPLYD_11870 [Anaerolineae bacterium]